MAITINGTTGIDVSGVLSLQTTTNPSAGTARIWSRSSDNNLYAQTASGNSAYFLDGSQNVMYAASSTSHIWNISNTERARITSGGSFLVGATSTFATAGVTSTHGFVSPTNGNWVAGFKSTTSATPWGLAVEYSAASPNDTSSNFLYCYDTSINRMNVRSNGGVANYSANNVNLSDRREKTNFAPAKNYLDTICAIPVQTFNYIDQNNEDDPGLTLGVVAQDVQDVAPEFVMESNWGTPDNPKMRLSIYQTDLQYALMKCIQELKAELDTTKARLAALEAN
jgi:hypothetical protein